MKLTTKIYIIELEKALKEANVPITDLHVQKTYHGFEIQLVIKGRIIEKLDYNSLIDFNSNFRFQRVGWMGDVSDSASPIERLKVWLNGLVLNSFITPHLKTKYGE